MCSLEKDSRRSWFETSSEALVRAIYYRQNSTQLMMSVFIETRKTKLYYFFYVAHSVHFYVKVHRLFLYHDATAPSGPRPSHYRGFMITLRHTTLRRTPLDEWSVRLTHLSLTIHNTHKRQTSMPLAGLEPTIPPIERQQTYALFRAATGIGTQYITPTKWTILINSHINETYPTCFSTCVPFSSGCRFLKQAFCSPWRWYTCTETCWRCTFNVCNN
jgi:hypothetical protein